LATLTTPLILILDDYHLIEADPIHHGINLDVFNFSKPCPEPFPRMTLPFCKKTRFQ
jgi:hypothetical protein